MRLNSLKSIIECLTGYIVSFISNSLSDFIYFFKSSNRLVSILNQFKSSSTEENVCSSSSDFNSLISSNFGKSRS